MFYKLSALALVGATFALPGAPAQYPDTTTSTTTVEHAPVYGAHTSSSSSSSSSSSTTKSAPVYGHPSSTTEPAKYSSTTEAGKYPSSTAKCPAPGSYDSQHRYSCNPAHAYPDGQTCELIDGCYFLKYGKTSSSEIPHYYPTTSEAPHYTTKVVTSLTTYCPEPTTFTHGASTYTVTKATTLTLPCPHGCTITKSQPPVYHPTGSVKTSSTVSKPETPKSYPPHETTVVKTTSTITVYKPTSVPVYSTKGTTYYSTSLTASYSVSTWDITKTVEKPKPTTAAPKPSCPVCPVQHCPPPVTVTTTVYTSMQPPPTYVAPPPHVPSSQAPPPSPYVPPQPTKETKTTEVKTTVKTTETKSVPAPTYPVVTKSTETHPVPTPSCPAPGSTDNKGRYSCNPAHQYPAGQTCKFTDGCPYLEYPKTTTEVHPPVYKPTTTESKPVSHPTPVCPAPGSTDNKGRYSCNPAHQYPAGQTCKFTDGCPYLEYPKTTTEVHPPVYKPTTTESKPVSHPTPVCPAPGSTDDKGRYSCNPAHQYPAGQTCKFTDGCPYLEYPKTTAPVYKPTTTENKPVSYPTPACPAPGTTDKNGQYSCNPAHSYPEGQTCKLVDGCYYLQYPKTTAPVYKPTTTESKPVSYPTPACPAPGSTDNKGRYSCNPAHAYPEGQTCELVDGCYFLSHPKPSTTKSIQTYPAHPTTYSSPPKYETTTKSIETPPAYTKPSSTESIKTYETPSSYSSSPPKYETTTTKSVEHPPQYTVPSSSAPVYEQPTTTPVVYSTTTLAAYQSTTESATTPAAYPTPKGY